MKSGSKSSHILLVCSSLNVAGGLERMVVSLTNLLSESNYAVSLLILGNTKESFYPINNNVDIVLLNADFGIGKQSNYLRRKLNFIKDIVRFRTAINNISPDCIITTEYTQTVATVFGQLHKKYKIIAWQHSSFHQQKSTFWKLFTNTAYKYVHRIVCLNADEESYYKKYNSQTLIIPNFINLSNEKVSNSNNNIILTVARLTPNKGIDLLMRCSKLVLERKKDWTWKIIGKGELKSDLIRFISDNKLTGKLIYQEPVSSVLDNEYSSSSIYALTSKVEPFGMVLLEAMSHGLPCVAFDCETGPRHIITHNVDGLLVEKENPEKLAEAICTLIGNKEKRSQMSKAAFENVKRFSSDKILKKWEELFNDLFHA